MSYQANGFRFPGQEPQNLWDMRGGPPLAVIAEIEAFIDRKESNNGPTLNHGPDIKVDELELMAAGNMSGRVSAFAEVEFPSDDNFSPEIGKTWLQVNDLAGEEGQPNHGGSANRFLRGIGYYAI